MVALSKVFALSAASVLLSTLLSLSAGAAPEAAPMHQHSSMGSASAQGSSPPPPFAATTAKPFSGLMDDAMNAMNDGMVRAPMNGDADHDFAAMMIAHHQGAVDMAKAQLLYGKNPVLRRLAQEIIVSQGSEIAVMCAELDKRESARAMVRATVRATVRAPVRATVRAPQPAPCAKP